MNDDTKAQVIEHLQYIIDQVKAGRVSCLKTNCALRYETAHRGVMQVSGPESGDYKIEFTLTPEKP